MSFPVDSLRFPATPEEMYAILVIEQRAKKYGGFTHYGISGYIYYAVIVSVEERAAT